MADPATIAQFVAVTGADERAASTWLEMTANKLEAAIAMFFEMTGSGSRSSGSGGGGSAGSSSSRSGHASGLGDSIYGDYGGGSSGAYGEDSPAGGSYGGNGSKRALDGGDPNDPDYVRPADETKRLRLLDASPPSSHYGGGAGYGYGFRLPAGAAAGAGAAVHPFRDFQAEAAAMQAAAAEGGAGGRSDDAVTRWKQQRLAEMFSAPAALMFSGSFQEARDRGKAESKWVMVNIQHNREFASHTLNRDTWKDETVVQVVQSMCIFWQREKEQPEAATYCQRYDVREMPHIGIIDPRTGRKEWEHTGAIKPEDLVEKLVNFAHHHSLEDGAASRAPPPPPAPRAASAASASIGDSQEEAELAAAMAASLAEAGLAPDKAAPGTDGAAAAAAAPANGSGGGGRNGGSEAQRRDSDASSDVAVVCVKPGQGGGASSTDGCICIDDNASSGGSASSAPAAGAAAAVPAPAPALWSDWFADAPLGEESPADDADTVKVKFRLANGKSSLRRFKKTDTVASLYRFAAAAVAADAAAPAGGAAAAGASAPAAAAAAGAVTGAVSAPKPFELRHGYPPLSLRDSADKTLAEANLANASINMKWTD